jgi:pilus assembly protein Flp/PilA
MKLFTPLLKFRRNTSGATAIEYCLIAGIICLAIIGGATAAGDAANGSFNKATTGFDAATAP